MRAVYGFISCSDGSRNDVSSRRRHPNYFGEMTMWFGRFPTARPTWLISLAKRCLFCHCASGNFRYCARLMALLLFGLVWSGTRNLVTDNLHHHVNHRSHYSCTVLQEHLCALCPIFVYGLIRHVSGVPFLAKVPRRSLQPRVARYLHIDAFPSRTGWTEEMGPPSCIPNVSYANQCFTCSRSLITPKLPGT